MIAALIIILLIILFLAFFIGKNLTNVCTLWLFKTYTDKSVVVVIFIADIIGRVRKIRRIYPWRNANNLAFSL